MTLGKTIGLSIAGILVLLFVADGWVVVPEGHVGVVKRFSKAIHQINPGLQFKLPVVDRVEEVEVRQRKNVEKMAGATQNQLPLTATVSINWTVHRDAALQMFVTYGGLSQFEERVLDNKLRSSAKAALAEFPADQLIRNRNAAVAAIYAGVIEATKDLPITIDSAQIENISLPEIYMDAVMEKERARETAKTEEHNLAKQNWIAQQEVQTANADRDARMARADGTAYQLKTEAAAEAEAIQLVNEQLAKSPQYIELVKAKLWNGAVPRIVLSDGTNMIMNLGDAGVR